MAKCPVCSDPNAQVKDDDDAHNQFRVDCPGCSRFRIPKNVLAKYHSDPKLLPRLRYRIRKMHRTDANDYPYVKREIAEKFASEPLPSIREQADVLLLRTGDELRESNPAGWVDLKVPECIATIGAYDKDALMTIVKTIGGQEQLINFTDSGDLLHVALTFKGWERYEEIKRTPSEARLAFMAMPFNDQCLDRVFNNYFKVAVEKTGFALRRIDEAPRAGVIDNNLRIEIRRARFLIAELTGGNAGAYWEAGFAEGLGRPVFYTCKKSYFKEHKTHFDANHCLTILWTDSDEELTKASAELKASIRATLPDEAILSDPDEAGESRPGKGRD